MRFMALMGLSAILLAASPQSLGPVFRLANVANASFPTAAAINTGGLLYDTTNNQPAFSDGTTWTALQQDFTDNQQLPIPEGRCAGNATRVAQTTFEGATFLLDHHTSFTTFIFRVTAQSGSPTGRFLIYQTDTGTNSGTARLKATFENVAIGTTGNFAINPAEGTVLLQHGIVWVLYGRDSALGSFTLRTYTTQTMDLLDANTDPSTVPTSFTTAIAANTSPSTFDPIGATTPSSLDVTLGWRIR